MADTLSVISLISFVGSILCLVIAIFFWFKFKIRSVIGDLTGHTAKKSIERMRSYNELSGGKVFKSSTVNVKRGKLTDTMPSSEKLKTRNNQKKKEQVETGLLLTNKVEMGNASDKKICDSSNTTALLNDEETVLLEDSNTLPPPEKQRKGVPLKIIDEIIFIHTDEVI